MTAPRHPLLRPDMAVAALALVVGAWLGAPEAPEPARRGWPMEVVASPHALVDHAHDARVRIAVLEAIGAQWRINDQGVVDWPRAAAGVYGVWSRSPTVTLRARVPGGAVSEGGIGRLGNGPLYVLGTDGSPLLDELESGRVAAHVAISRHVTLLRLADAEGDAADDHAWTLDEWRAAVAAALVAPWSLENPPDFETAHVFSVAEAVPALRRTHGNAALLGRVLAGDASAASSVFPATETRVPGFWTRVLATATDPGIRRRAEHRFLDGPRSTPNDEILEAAVARGEVAPSAELQAWIDSTAWSRGWRVDVVRGAFPLGIAFLIDALALVVLALGLGGVRREARVALCAFAVAGGLAVVAVDVRLRGVDVAHDAFGLLLAAVACWRLSRDGAGRAAWPAAAAFAAAAALACLPFHGAQVGAALGTTVGVVALLPLATVLRPRTRPTTRLLPLRPHTASRFTTLVALACAAFVALPMVIDGPMWMLGNHTGAVVLIAAAVSAVTFALRLASSAPQRLPWIFAIAYPLFTGLAESSVLSPTYRDACVGLAVFALAWGVAVLVESGLRVAGLTGRWSPERPSLGDRLRRRSVAV